MKPIKYIALLRGINVGGHNVPMARLRELFAELGFDNVRTYIQTGNVFFESGETDAAGLTDKIEHHLQMALNYEVPTFVRTVEQLAETLAVAPFDRIELTPETRHLIVFISGTLPADLKLPLFSPKGDYELVGLTPGAVFVVVHLINGKFASSNFLEKTYGVQTTVRFYHTATKILAAAEAG